MKTIGQICGGLGALMLLSSPFTLFVTSGSWTAAGIKAGIGVALLIVWLVTREPATAAPAVKGSMGQGARTGFFYGSSALLGVVLIGGLAAGNFVAARRAGSWDLTHKQIHSLAPQTRQTLKALKDPIKVLAFLPSANPARDEFELLFKRYAKESDLFTWEFKDPFKSPDLAQKYQLREGQLPVVMIKGSGETEMHTTLNAAVFSEEAVTQALIKLNTVGTQRIYFVVGHGEWTLTAPERGLNDEQGSLTTAAEFKSNLAHEGYAPEQLNLAQSRDIPRDASLLIIAGASSKFTDTEVAMLDRYLEQGGRLLYFADQGKEPGLDAVLAKNGVQVDNGLLVDDKVSPTSPYVIVSGFYGDHEIAKTLKQQEMNIQMPTARGLSMLKLGVAPGVIAVPVATTSQFAWEELKPSEHPTLDSGEKTGAIPIVIAVTRDAKGAADKRFDEGRLVVFGDAELLVDALWGHEPNRNLVLNSVAWASNQIQNITIRPPDRDISTIDLDESMLAKIRFLSMDLLPVLLVGVGLSIWLKRRNK